MSASVEKEVQANFDGAVPFQALTLDSPSSTCNFPPAHTKHGSSFTLPDGVHATVPHEVFLSAAQYDGLCVQWCDVAGDVSRVASVAIALVPATRQVQPLSFTVSWAINATAGPGAGGVVTWHELSLPLLVNDIPLQHACVYGAQTVLASGDAHMMCLRSTSFLGEVGPVVCLGLVPDYTPPRVSGAVVPQDDEAGAATAADHARFLDAGGDNATVVDSHGEVELANATSVGVHVIPDDLDASSSSSSESESSESDGSPRSSPPVNSGSAGGSAGSSTGNASQPDSSNVRGSSDNLPPVIWHAVPDGVKCVWGAVLEDVASLEAETVVVQFITLPAHHVLEAALNPANHSLLLTPDHLGRAQLTEVSVVPLFRRGVTCRAVSVMCRSNRRRCFLV